MYTGVKNHHVLPRVTSYEDAQRALDVWTSKTRRGIQVVQVNGHDNGDIAFQLYATEVVTWAPDNSVTIDNYGTLTTSGFASQFLPNGIWLNFPTYRRGCSGGANTIRFRADCGPHICQGGDVRFVESGLDWVPDTETCYELKLPTGIDRKGWREAAKRYHLPEFENWLSVAPIMLEAAGNPLEHDCWDVGLCMDALEARDWRGVAEHLPLIEDSGAYGTTLKPLAIRTNLHQHHVTMSSFAKLKTAIQDDLGLITTDPQLLERRDGRVGQPRRSLSRVPGHAGWQGRRGGGHFLSLRRMRIA